MQTLSDFPDRIPPMLVKELRQGLRAKAFVFQFLFFQGIMLALLLVAAAGADPEDAGSTVSNIIIIFFAITALILQPLRGTTALSSEITGNTMEMMALTRLSSTRIVLGKWFSLVSQTCLLLVTIIPYLILRYFFGGMNIFSEMVLLAVIFFTSAVLSAVTVGLSARANKLARLLPIPFILAGMAYIPGRMLGASLLGIFSVDDFRIWLGLGIYLIITGYYAWCALNLGISLIAPTAENHSTTRRLVALLLTLLIAACSFWDEIDPTIPPVLLALITGPAILIALTEPSVLLPPVCVPFLKRGTAGRIAAVFLYPGWPAGVFYSALLLAIGIGSCTLSGKGIIPDDESIGILSGVGSILFPALLAALFTKVESKRFAVFLAFLIISILVTTVASVFLNIWHEEDLLWFLIWNPSTFLPLLAENGANSEKILFAVMVVDAFLLLGLLIRAGITFRAYLPVVQEAELALNRGKE